MLLRLEPEMLEMLRKEAAKQTRPMTNLVVHVLKEYLSSKSGK